MNTKKILSGHDLIAKGCTKLEVSLPEIGYKEVIPDGSWLQQKQIQSAIESRKHLLDVQRIEKSGTLSHAEWREELMLAEVVQKVGSYWHFVGHSKGKQLFLQPEEALFLMEVNCLQLKHNGMRVSLQQAYSLLLRGRIQILQYKVYASLSRLGYRVYRHEYKVLKNTTLTSREDPINKVVENGIEATVISETILMETDDIPPANNSNIEQTQNIGGQSNNPVKQSYQIRKLQKLKTRTLKPANEKNIHNFFENFPELANKQIVFMKAPSKEHIPNSIDLKKTVYTINLQNIHMKNIRSVSMDTNIYSANDEVNGSHIRRIRNSSTSSSNNWSQNYGFANQNMQYNLNYARTRQQYGQFNFSMLFQKHFVPNWLFTPRFQLVPTQNTWHNYDNKFNRKRRKDNLKHSQLEEIKKLACKLKQLILRGNTEEQNIQSLQNLIQAYNIRYKTKLRLNDNFNIVDESVLDTIELDDEDGPSDKRLRIDDNKFEENLNMLKKLAAQLKDLEKTKKSSARHRRAFSKVLKTFNKSYNEEYYLSDKYEPISRDHIDLASSETDESDDSLKFRSGKKLRNPFNILKRLSESQNESIPSTSNVSLTKENKKYSQLLLKTFTKDWLPPEDDFGRAEIVSKDTVKSELIDLKREQFLFDFLKIQTCKCNNWLELKKSFFTSIEKAIVEFQRNTPTIVKSGVSPILKPNDCSDTVSVLEKLRIIKNENSSSEECNLSIDFDVYKRNVQNFKKTLRPIPHFRIICVDEKSKIPPGEEISSLHSKYNDNVTIVFALVGADSVTYLRINPSDIPLHISNTKQ